MSAWANAVPVVTVSRSETPKPVTFVYPYYQNREFFTQQLAGWFRYPEALRAHLSVIVVDDGSPEPLEHIKARPFALRQFRIARDIPWNWLAARNIGMHHAAHGWCLMTDMDHVVPAETAEALVFGQHDPTVAYAFSRVEHTGETVHPHSASWFLKKSLFWQIGGYDESYSGSYGTDGLFRRRLMASATTRVLSDTLIRHEHVADASTSAYERKTPADAARLRQITASLKPNHRPKTLSFPYREVGP